MESALLFPLTTGQRAGVELGGVPTFTKAIVDVVCGCSEKKVVRTYTPAVIAMVTNEYARRDWANAEFIRQTVRGSHKTRDAEFAVTSAVAACRPLPTPFRPLNFGPEPPA